MSWRATAAVKELTHDAAGHALSRSEKLLLFVLADYYNDDAGKAWASLNRIAGDALMSRRQVIRVMARLEANGVINVKRRDNQNNIYTFNFITGSDKMSPPPSDTMSPASDIRCHYPSDTMMSPEPQENRNKKTKSKSLAAADSRHHSIQQYIMARWQMVNGTTCPWDGACAKQLSDVLKSVPVWDMQTLERCVDARFCSDCNHADHPTKWLCNRSRRLTDYINGPLDRFGNPPNGGNSGNTAEARKRDNANAIGRAASRLGFD